MVKVDLCSNAVARPDNSKFYGQAMEKIAVQIPLLELQKDLVKAQTTLAKQQTSTSHIKELYLRKKMMVFDEKHQLEIHTMQAKLKYHSEPE